MTPATDPRPPRPPRAAEDILLAALGRTDETRTVLGDLAEDYARIAGTRGVNSARLWYWREALGIAVSGWIDRKRSVLRMPEEDGRMGRMRDVVTGIGVVQDTTYAVGAVRKDMAFAVFAVLVIGLGVGASTAVFSVLRPLLIEPLPFDQPDRLVWVANDAGAGLSGVTSRTSNLRDFRELARSFDGLTGYNAFFDQASYNLVGTGEPERLVGVGVADDFLDVLGVEPAVGRDFVEEEGLVGGPPAVMLTHGYWTRRFAADPGVVGTSLTINDEPREVVGVLPESFDFSSVFTPTVPVDFLLTWPIADETDRQGNTTVIVGRLKPGVTVETAQAELDNVIAGLQEADPQRWGLGANVSGLQERVARPYRSAMLLLAAAAAVVMLIVCVNLSNMLLARAPRRRREMAIRRTMGATRGRLVRQLLLESVIVSMLGAAVGLLVARSAVAVVTGTTGLELPLLSSVTVDFTALAFTIALALAAGVLVGIVPALQVAEGGEAEALAGSSRGSSSGPAARRLREILVVGEIAMACILLVFGGLVLESFRRVMDVEMGFDPVNTVAWQLAASRPFESNVEGVAFFDQIAQRVAAVPGVEAVGLTDALPLGRNRTWGRLRVVGITLDDRGNFPSYFPHIVDHRYLGAMGIDVLRGRAFGPGDDADSAPVAIVNETAARIYFGGDDAIGHMLDMWYGGVEVVGVVEDVRHRGLDIASDPEVYFPVTQLGDYRALDLVVRTSLPEAVVAGPISAAIRAVDPQMPVEDHWTLESVVERSVSPRRFTLQLLSAFALSALLLAGIGIYGVLSYSVTERIPEIGIRMALGESADQVRRAVVSRTLALASVGVVIGVLASVAGSRLISSLLFGIEPTDPVTFAVMIVVLMSVALVSGLIPAVRASRVDSARALRSAG